MSLPQLSVINSELLSIKETHLTPTEIVEATRELFDGDITLDPCTNFEINARHVRANNIFDINTNGLSSPWFGNVLVNPPGRPLDKNDAEAAFLKEHKISCKSVPIAWWHKLRMEHSAGRVNQAIFVVFNPKQLGYAPDMWSFPICFTAANASASCVTGSGRIKYLDLVGDELIEQGSPTNNGAIIYLPPKVETPLYVKRFYQLFEQFGVVGRMVR